MANVWIFQSNPKKYNLFIELNDPNCQESSWTVRQHKDEIKKGDIALHWISGKNRGIYSIIDIISDPDLMYIDPSSWKEYDKVGTQELMVEYRYRSKFKQPILESEIQTIPGLSKLSIMRSHTGTNFPVTSSEWEILSKEIKKRELDGSHEINKSSDTLELMRVYSRDDLKTIFKIDDATINNGIFKPKDASSIWLFITEEKTPDRTQYRDYFDGQTLVFEGQTKRRTDYQIIDHEHDGNEIIVFYRKKRNEFPNFGFKYLGRFYYSSHTSPKAENTPTRFELFPLDIAIDDDTEDFVKADPVDKRPTDGKYVVKVGLNIQPLAEGKEKKVIQTRLERNPKLRRMALDFHGAKCIACGFIFAEKYGTLGDGYIEIHHLIPVSEYKGKGEVIVDPKTDLKPLCSNCHRMIHKRADMLSIEQLQNIMKS